MRRALVVLCVLVTAFSAAAGDRVPEEHWMQYADPAEAGFDPAKLAAAKEAWQAMPSSAFMVVADGAVVAAWGDVSRRFMCHSVRKSFMSALYGIYWDRGSIDLNKTMVDLGVDDQPDELLESEKQARILDLLKARSGVFHPAAYAGRTDSQPRGSQGPGRYFAYNNWDFNTLVTILEQETGDKVFEAFDQYFARPLGMEDWRVSDGYYHYERDKSMHPAYPFRLSARDAARFGLVFTRNGLWNDERILSRDWVQRSTAMYSIDDETIGYGLLWWVYREPRFKQYGMASALGVGNQMIAVLPDIDMVIVNRADTYRGENTPRQALRDLIEEILEARVGEPVSEPNLVPLTTPDPDPRLAPVANEELAEYVGDWPYPPEPLGLPHLTTLSLTLADGALAAYSEVSGTFLNFRLPDGTFIEEDTYQEFVAVRNDDGSFAGLAEPRTVARAAVLAAVAEDPERAAGILDIVEGSENINVRTSRALVGFLGGKPKEAEKDLRELAAGSEANRVEATINFVGYSLIEAERINDAKEVFELNTRVFPQAFNTWDSLAEIHMTLGHEKKAIRFYEKSLELNPDNANATTMIARIRGEED